MAGTSPSQSDSQISVEEWVETRPDWVKDLLFWGKARIVRCDCKQNVVCSNGYDIHKWFYDDPPEIVVYDPVNKRPEDKGVIEKIGDQS